MTRRRVTWLVTGAAAVLAVFVSPPTAAAAPQNSGVVVENGVTQPVFGYADAIRERVWVEADFDTDADGANDRIALDIIRPPASDLSLKAPVIMDASPYYSTLGRGNESELKRDLDGDGLLDRWPLFYDNYFVPRGYAVVLLDMVGTSNSTGCPVTGGTPDHLSAVAGIDWLNGRRKGYDKDGNEVVADWHNGRTAMIGKSYDGTLANGAASTGVDGLSTIVPISAISSWYDYTRSNGVVTRGNSYPSFLSNTVTNPDRRAHCAAVRAGLALNDGDESGDYTPFWVERDYKPDARNVHASVFVVHGLQDDNVMPDHFSKWWDALPANVAKKLWLTRTGHIDPFDFRRAEWVSTLHRWFDHELQGVPNDVLNEAQADVEYAADEWRTYTHWPVDSREQVSVKLLADTPTTAGALTLGPPPTPNLPRVYQTITDTPFQNETTAISNPTTVTANRRVFLSGPLEAPVHVSGTPVVRVRASVNATDTNFGGLLVDYGPATQVSRSGDGARTLVTEDCWGETSATDEACYLQVEKRLTTVTQWRVSKGILDALNRNSYAVAEPLVPNVEDSFTFPLLPQDYVFPAGHRIGLVLLGSYSGYGSQPDQNRATISLNVTETLVDLPVVGGKAALTRAGLEKATPADVIETPASEPDGEVEVTDLSDG
jgi:X-Pro dipeptidyl-peptidase